ncbi:MAG: site-specific integrase [Alphaproteobacteria bacterium]|nr:site-specific integrase [Rhodospirillales bacterium]MCW9045324.1 site-specific integrase [Alphaproteobacteria bacterium]
MPRLTKKFVENVAIPDEKYITVWDDKLIGFGVRVRPSGKKAYIVQAKKNRKTIRKNVGIHGTLTADQAREAAADLLRQIHAGVNPNEEAKKEQAKPTVSNLCQQFLDEYVPSHCKPRTAVEYRHCVDKYITPALGSLKVENVAREDVAKLHNTMRNVRYQANRTLGVLSVIFNQAEVWGLRPERSNPCYNIKKYKEQKRERFLSPAELSCLGEALKEEAEFASSAVTAFWLLIYTGARLSEIQTLKWEYVRGNKIHLPDSKTGAKGIPLNQPALEVLSNVARIEGNPYVIAGKQDGAFLTDLQKPWRRIRKQATVLFWLLHTEAVAKLIKKLTEEIGQRPTWEESQKAGETENLELPVGLADVRIHDLRHTFASEAVMTGESLPMIGKILGHTQTQTTARYAHLADDPLQSASERIASSLKKAMAG